MNVQICEFGDVAYFRHIPVLLYPCGKKDAEVARTTKDIKKGTELITDYGSEYWEDP